MSYSFFFVRKAREEVVEHRLKKKKCFVASLTEILPDTRTVNLPQKTLLQSSIKDLNNSHQKII